MFKSKRVSVRDRGKQHRNAILRRFQIKRPLIFSRACIKCEDWVLREYMWRYKEYGYTTRWVCLICALTQADAIDALKDKCLGSEEKKLIGVK